MGGQVREQCAGVCVERFGTSMYGGKFSSVVSLNRQPPDKKKVTSVWLTGLASTGSMLNSAQSPGFP
jgi:hypothetical protein